MSRKISHQLAVGHVEAEFEKFGIQRRQIKTSRLTSDFDKLAKKIIAKKPKKK